MPISTKLRRLLLVASIAILAAPAALAQSAHDRFDALLGQVATRPTADQQRALDAFIAAQRPTFEGFPLRRGNDVTFVYKAKTAGPVSVAGEWNGWRAGATPLRRLGQTDVWVAQVTMPAPDRYQYKIVDHGRWVGDPLNRKFAYPDANAVVNLQGSFKSHLELHPAWRSTKLRHARDVIVYVPAGALDGPDRFPVLYMQDGQNLFDPDSMWGGWGVDETVDGLVSSGAIRRVIVVGIGNTPDRMDEYSPAKDDNSDSCDGSQVFGGKAPAYADFMIHELKPAIDRIYPTLPDRANTAVLGSSLGGLVSLWLGVAHPEVFRDAGGMSSTLGVGGWCLHNPRVVDLARQKGRQDVLFYLDSGGDPTSGDDNYKSTVELKDLLASQGYTFWPKDPNGHLCHWWEPGATHDEAHWRARLEKPLLYWFHN